MSHDMVITIIEGLFTCLAALLAANVAQNISHQIIDSRKFKEEMQRARSDLSFLLAVERKYGELMKEHSPSGYSHFRRVRESVADGGYVWSGRNTRRRLERLSALSESNDRIYSSQS